MNGRRVGHRPLAPSLALTASLLLGLAPAASSDDAWLEDPVTGCKIWTDEVKSGEVAAWSGGCEGGKADGRGTLTLFKDGKLLGRFVGSMEAGKAQGVGEIHYLFDDGFAHYTGSLKDSELHGEGLLVKADGTRYEGEFEASRAHGLGVETFPDGSYYSGEYVEGERHGLGYDGRPDGELYRGEYHQGKRHGQGTLVSKIHGYTYSGAFEKGDPHGLGRAELADGTVIEGRFRDGEADGPAVLILPDGTRRQAVFQDGELVE